MAITLRTVTGSALNFLQVDENFSSYYYSASISASTFTLFRTGSSLIGVPPSSSSIVLPLPSKWTDITGGIQRTSLVRVVGPFAQGNSNTSAGGVYSHAQGDDTTASGTGSHAEGYLSVASGIYSHTEARQTQATGPYSHAEGYLSEASGIYSHAEGRSTLASGTGSHAEGLGTIASGDYQHTQGKYNIASSEESAFIIGNGISDGSRSNLIHAAGTTVQVTGSLNVNGAINTVGNLTVQGNITAQQYIVSTSVYYVTESYNSGSHIFGNSLDDTHQFTGSVLITGSLNVTSGITGSLFGTASRALSASWAPNTSPIEVYNNFSDLGTLYSTAPGGGPASSTTNVTASIMFGWNAGGSSNNVNGVTFLGNRAGRNTVNIDGSNFIGSETGLETSASRSNFIGQYTGRYATNASNSNFFGYAAGNYASAASDSNFLGYQAGGQATSASNSNFFGRSAGQSAVSASFSTLIGHQVGFEATATASNSIGSNNIIIGTNITLAAQQRNAINLGGIIFATGSYATTTGNPFSGSMPSSRVGIATSTPQFTLDVNGSGNFTSNLTVTGSSTFVGPVNMGNTTGAGNLTVTSDQPYLFLTRGNGDTSILLNTGDTTVSASLDVLNNQFFEINTNARLKLSTGKKERITIQNDGGIIINSGSQATAPTVLQITGSVSISDILTLTRRTTTPTPVEGMIIASGSAGASILYYYNGTTWNALF